MKAVVRGIAGVALLCLPAVRIVHRHTVPNAAQTAGAPPQASHLFRAGFPQASGTPLSAADTDDLYQEKCALCHNPDRTGKPPAFPSLIGVSAKYTDAQITDQIRHGKGRMPAFPSLTEEEVKALISYMKAPAQPAAGPSAGNPVAPALRPTAGFAITLLFPAPLHAEP